MKKEILIIDDYIDYLVEIKKALCRNGLAKEMIDTSYDIENAIERIKENEYRVIISDLKIKGTSKSTVDFLTTIKERFETTEIIVMSAYPEEINAIKDLKIKHIVEKAQEGKNFISEIIELIDKIYKLGLTDEDKKNTSVLAH